MPSTEEAVATAVQALKDPEIGRSLGDLRMLGAVDIGRDGATVHIKLPGPGYPVQDELRSLVVDVTAAAMGADRETVSVVLNVMDESDQERVADILSASTQGGDGPAALPGTGSGTRVIGISSGKGGVGKSSVTVNLAIALAKAGSSVGILDADVYGFSIPGMLGVSAPPMAVHRLVVPPKVHGVRCLSMGFFLDDDQPVIWRGPMLHKALNQFITEAWWGDIDYLLVDMPPGTGDVALSMAEFLPKSEVIVVTTPQPTAQRVAQRSAYAAKKLNLPVRGVVENMSWFTGDDGVRYEIFGSGGGEELAAKLGVPLLGQVPLVPSLRQGSDEGMPVTVSDPGGEAAAAFDALAQRISSMGSARRYRPELRVR